MKIIISDHAIERMKKYGLSQDKVIDCILNPDIIVSGREKRKIAQKRLNSYNHL